MFLRKFGDSEVKLVCPAPCRHRGDLTELSVQLIVVEGEIVKDSGYFKKCFSDELFVCEIRCQMSRE